MTKHVGIVLKRYCFDRPRFVVFDRHEGKITCTVAKKQMVIPGSIVSYFIVSRGARCRLSSLEILDVPLSLARSHIIFLHHLLELCFYFLPVASQAFEVFDLFIFFYKNADTFITPLHKKIFLFKLFVSFGFYGGHAPLSVDLFGRLNSESIDSIVDSLIHLEIERSIDQWLYCCMQAHPQSKDFKTVRFLKRIGCYEKT